MYRAIPIGIFAVLLGACASGPAPKQESGSILVNANDAIAIDSKVKSDFQAAVAHMKSHEYEDAIKLLESIVKRENRVTAPFVNLGIAYMAVGEMDKAENNLVQAIKLDPSHPVANNELGLLYRRTGRFEKAKQVYKKTLAMYPDFLPVRKNLAVLCDIYMDDLDCALENFEVLASYRPDDEKLKIWIAEIKARMAR